METYWQLLASAASGAIGGTVVIIAWHLGLQVSRRDMAYRLAEFAWRNWFKDINGNLEAVSRLLSQGEQLWSQISGSVTAWKRNEMENKLAQDRLKHEAQTTVTRLQARLEESTTTAELDTELAKHRAEANRQLAEIRAASDREVEEMKAERGRMIEELKTERERIKSEREQARRDDAAARLDAAAARKNGTP